MEEGDGTPVARYEEQQIPLAEIPRRRTRERLVEDALGDMSLEQLVGQRFVTWLEGSEPTGEELRLVSDGLVGGFIVYPRNVVDRVQVSALTAELQRAALSSAPAVGLLLAADQEGGRVAALRLPDMPQFPAARAWGRHEDEDYVEAASYVVNRELASVGINMNFAPVLDVYGVANDSIIGDRSFGPDPRTVAGFVRPYLEASRAAGVIATAKHFPGHGLTTIDTHHDLPVVGTTKDELFAADLLPFREAINAEVPAIMTGHLLFDRIDPFYPVTLSRVFLHEVLRRELGFEGVVVSDGLEMGAIANHYSLPDTLVRLFKFDVDLILLYRDYDVVEIVQMVEELIDAGELTEDDVNRGARRVLALKRRYGLVDAEAL